MGCCSLQCGLLAGAVLGAAVAILGGVLIPLGDSMIRQTVHKEAVIEQGTTAYENWVSTGGTVYRQFWFFNVTNPSQAIYEGSKPQVVQRGPYTYRVRYRAKENITNFANNTISFLLPLGAIFDRSQSVGPEEDTVVALNLAVAGAYSLVPKNLHFLLEGIIQRTNSSLFQQRTVKELLWGYLDPLLDKTVGLFSDYNTSSDGPYGVFTGKEDISKLGLIDTWQRNSVLNHWNDTYCDMLNGTDASSFTPFVVKNKPLYFFSSDICRSVLAIFQKSVDLKGIQVYRFTLPADTMASPSDNPNNHCFCRDMDVTRNCTMAGVLDVSACSQGMPIYISLPHFLYGSAYLTQDILGLSPSLDEHETYLDVEPTTGFTLGFAKRLQVNMMYGPSKVITVLKKVKDYTIFPVVWLNETAVLDEETAEMFKAELLSRIQMLDTVQKTLIGLGVAMFVVFLISYCVVKNRKQDKFV